MSIATLLGLSGAWIRVVLVFLTNELVPGTGNTGCSELAIVAELGRLRQYTR